MKKISSFTVNHLTMKEGIYISRVDGNIVTFDLRFCKPYSGYLLTNEQLHTIEHLIATILRNNMKFEENIVYFGPMGCQTGFYLLVDMSINNITKKDVIDMILSALNDILDWSDEIPGNSQIECGNCHSLNLETAKIAVKRYKDFLEKIPDLENQIDNY